MSLGIKVYKVSDFIRKTESGAIDLEKSLQIVREISAAAGFHVDHNILIDLRDTTLLQISTNDVMQVVTMFVNLMPNFKNKIASLVPSAPDRISIAEKVEACMKIHDYDYRFFHDYEAAIDWLSEIQE
jgi:hypothetical protein